METLGTGLFLAAVNEKLVDYFIAVPLKRALPELNTWWLLYVALATGLVIAWFSGVNLFGVLIPNELVARIVTGVAIGGGSSLVHNVLGR